MGERKTLRIIFVLIAACAFAAQAGDAGDRRRHLGKVHFPTSAQSEKAQEHFLRGVSALHSFWYPVALEEFRAATQTEPGFLMGYWGEALSHNHPIWGDPQDTEAARKVLAKLNDLSGVTPRERGYLKAVQLLYGEGDKPARDSAYAEAMEEIYREYPEDLEAASLYSLALLGTIGRGSLHDPVSTRTRMRAAAIAGGVIRKEPGHPGAVHYLIHAFDDPDHAVLALPAARRYSEIAPDAPHALHMPSHIFLQLGMWPEAAAANEASWTASDEWVKRRELPVSQRDYHSLHWLHYIYLQQGRYQKANELLSLMEQSLAAFPRDDARNVAFGSYTRATMSASFLVETERWEQAAELIPPPPDERKSGGSNSYQAFASLAKAPSIFARGLAAAQNDTPGARESLAQLRGLHETLAGKKVPFAAMADLIPVVKIQALQIAAASSAARKDLEKAIQKMKDAVELERAMPPPSGPPLTIKPSHELFGEILLRAERPKQAAEHFARSLFRHPNRARSLLGAARAAARQGHFEAAARFYRAFEQQWRMSEAQTRELHEARRYLKKETTEKQQRRN